MLLVGWTFALLYQILCSTFPGVDKVQERPMDALVSATYAEPSNLLVSWDKAERTMNGSNTPAPRLQIQLCYIIVMIDSRSQWHSHPQRYRVLYTRSFAHNELQVKNALLLLCVQHRRYKMMNII